jgi:hypothetical protein
MNLGRQPTLRWNQQPLSHLNVIGVGDAVELREFLSRKTITQRDSKEILAALDDMDCEIRVFLGEHAGSQEQQRQHD